jgi:L-fuconolactonase
MNKPGQRVDAHQHFWRVARGDYRWLLTDDASLAPLRRDFGPADLQPLRAAHGIAQTVLVQAADSAAETDFLLDLAVREESVGGVVGWVDLTRADSVATLERWAAHPKFKGVRPMLQDLPQHDWILHAPHADVLDAIERLGLRFDALVKPWHLDALLAFVQRHPGLPVVIDHAAKPQLAQGWSAPWADDWRRGMAALADQPQVCCKVSGLLTEAPPLGAPDEAVALLRPVWDTLLEHFGPERLMWGSDWPVLTLAASYERWVAVSETLIGELTPGQQQAVWHDNARRFYALTDA